MCNINKLGCMTLCICVCIIDLCKLWQCVCVSSFLLPWLFLGLARPLGTRGTVPLLILWGGLHDTCTVPAQDHITCHNTTAAKHAPPKLVNLEIVTQENVIVDTYLSSLNILLSTLLFESTVGILKLFSMHYRQAAHCIRQLFIARTSGC